MIKDIRIPNASLYVLVLAAEEVMGKNGLIAVFRQGDLGMLITSDDNIKYPPNNMDKQIPYSLYGKIQQAIEDFYGSRGSRAILMRVGRANFRYTLHEKPALVGLGGVIMKALPMGTRQKLILNGSNKAANDEFHMESILMEEDDTFIMRRTKCPCQFRQRDKGYGPCDHVTVGSLQEGLKWATGKVFKIRQTRCLNIGDDVDEFIVNKTPEEG
ncbi:MAG: hypothetical protein B6242_07185 [Anaerolineaceae bacterium 4572_78]|nr:MAG: hypothetical protein B6242_07185 [Anaerolineaceae bacterium 4572_78]